MVLAFGEVLWDLLPSGKQLGGAVANCAYRLHQLDTEVRFVSRIGNDELGKEAQAILKKKGLPCPLLQLDETRPTGTVDVTVSSEGDADYVINPEVAYDYIELSEELLECARNARALVFGNLIQREETSRKTLYALIDAAPQALKVVDINLRKDCYTRETVFESFQRTDVLKLNDKEVAIVSELLGLECDSLEDFCKTATKQFGISTILISLGARGVLAHDVKEGFVSIPGYPTQVVDTVGAGDNFTAGFVHKRLQGESLAECCAFANLIGSLLTTKTGGMPAIEMGEINAYRETQEQLQASA